MIRLRNVRFEYREKEPVLDGADLEIGGGLTLLLGPNGSGKSTLLKLIAGVERPDRGTVELGGLDLWKREVEARRELAYVPEQPDLTPYATIADVLRLVCRLRAERADRVTEALDHVGLARVASRSIRELSMGQRRRAVLAAAWIGSPRIIVLDEPLESMDRAIRADILAWIDKSLAAGAAVLIATHEIEPFIGKAARAVTVRQGNCRLFQPLPEQVEERITLLESLSRQSVDLA
jgi:ABC-type multidrug transport system ATPase subunit